MQTARACRRDIASLPPAPAPAPAPVPAVEYVLIGPAAASLEELAQLFAGLEHPTPRSNGRSDPGQTQEIPTIRIRVWNQAGGRRRVEVRDHRGEAASVLFERAHLFAR